MRKNKELIHDFGKYTIVFLLILATVFCWFLWNDKSFIWIGSQKDLQDGLTQHYSTFVYYGQYLRDFFKNLFFHHTLEMNMWDWNIGYGSDIITTLHYYGIGEPLMFLSCLVPVKYSQMGYCFFIVLRIYLAGGAFLLFCSYHNRHGMAAIMGGIIYCMSGYTMYAGIRHPMFLIPLILFPVICLGIDKIYRERKPVVFIVATALAGMSNFYFFYMECIFLAGYIVLRYVMVFQKIKIKEMFGYGVLFLCSGIVAVLMAAVLLLPNIMVLLTSERLWSGNYVPLHYEWSYYTKLFSGFMGGSGRYYSNLGYGVIPFLSVCLLFIKKERRTLKVLFLLLSVFLCIPWVGYVLNGFSYVTNRWIWVYNFFIAFLVTKMLPELLHMKRGEKIRLSVICGMYVFVCMLCSGTRRTQVFVLFGVLGFFLVMIFLEEMEGFTEKKMRGVLWSVFWMSYAVNGLYAYGHMETNLLSEFLDSGKGLEELSTAAASLVDNQAYQYRFDQYGITEPYNAAWYLNQRGVSYHFSLTNPYISQFYRELGLNTPYDYSYNNLDGRSALEALACVNQFMVPREEEGYLPYYYRDHKRVTTEEISVFSTSRTLPVGYTYDSYVNRKDYDKFNTVEKQEAMLQGVVLESEMEEMPKTKIKLETEELDFTIESEEGCLLEEDSIFVRASNSKVKLCFDKRKDCELYVEFSGIRYEEAEAFSCYTQEEMASLGTFEKNKIKSEQKYNSPEVNPYFYVKGNGIKKEVNYLTSQNSFYCGRDDFTVNIGYLDKARDSLTLIFPKSGRYSFDSIKVIAQPVKNFDDRFFQRKEDSLENVSLQGNRMTGEIFLKEQRILCVSLPYSSGWKAYVDGEETTIHRANTMYMAFLVTPGEHEIVLEYETPYLKIGLWISIAGVMLFMGMLIVQLTVERYHIRL